MLSTLQLFAAILLLATLFVLKCRNWVELSYLGCVFPVFVHLLKEVLLLVFMVTSIYDTCFVIKIT